ncbi:MAG: GYD domain-containing protein [Thermoproteus sp. AZ2]|uniref:GYD domain-containing protein n=1 Tax=Thermoproteus sp. AZ2 TaxID=1609232 RepID=A0ACC6UZK8_9CREN
MYFVVLSKLTDKGAETILERPERIKEVNAELEQVGARVLHQFVLFGDYDFVNVLEVKDIDKFFKKLVELNRRGTIHTTTYLAIPVDEAIDILKK